MLVLLPSCVQQKDTAEDKHKIELSVLQSKISKLEYGIKLQNSLFKLERKTEGLLITEQRVFWNNDSLVKKSLSSLFNKKKLVFCYSKSHCTPCVDHITLKLKDCFDDYLNNEDIICIVDIPDKFKNISDQKKILSGVQLPIDILPSPILFILGEDMRIRNLYVYNKMNPEALDIYIEEVVRKTWVQK